MSELVWQEVATETSKRPSLPRSGHSATALPEEHAYDVLIFGGYAEDGDKQRRACNETWVFSLSEGAWSQAAQEGPVPRARLAAQLCCVGGAAWLLGGWDPGTKGDGGDMLDDVWRLDLQTYRWEQMQLKGCQMQAVSRFQAVAVGPTIYIHTHRTMSELLVLDTTTATLSSLPVATPQGAPSSRGLHSINAVGGKLYLFGGAPQRGPVLADAWEFDIQAATWSPLQPAGEQPHARCSQAAAAVHDAIYMHGGAFYRDDGCGLECLDDLLVLDTAAAEWRYPTVSGTAPTARNAATMVAVGSTLVLHGGWKAFQETYNSTFIMHV